MVDLVRGIVAIAVSVLLSGGPLAAQEREMFPMSIDAFGSVDWVSIYEGDSFFGVGFTWGFTGSLVFRSGSPLGGEIFLAFTPSDDGRDFATPRIFLSGGWATFSLSKDPRESWDVFVAAGAVYLNIAGWPVPPDCSSPPCFGSRWPDIVDEASWVVVWGGGATYRPPGRLSLRLDVRVPSGTEEIEERTTRVGLGFGFRVR